MHDLKTSGLDVSIGVPKTSKRKRALLYILFSNTLLYVESTSIRVPMFTMSRKKEIWGRFKDSENRSYRWPNPQLEYTTPDLGTSKDSIGSRFRWHAQEHSSLVRPLMVLFTVIQWAHGVCKKGQRTHHVGMEDDYLFWSLETVIPSRKETNEPKTLFLEFHWMNFILPWVRRRLSWRWGHSLS